MEVNEIMDTYEVVAKQISPSTEVCQKIISGNPPVRHLHNKMLIFYLVLVIMVALFIPTTGYAAYHVSEVLYEKVKSAGYTKEELETLETNLTEWGFSQEEIADLEELGVNENGLTYGPDVLGADLILVCMDEGGVGYVYRQDMENLAISSPEEASDCIEEVKLTVYASDGVTEIGTFTVGGGVKE